MKKAFTLIELLVVVLIIGILSAIALPQYQKAVQKSRMTEVAVHIKPIEQAIELYMLENELPTSGVVDLFDVNPDLTNGLTKKGDNGWVNTSYWASKYAIYQVYCDSSSCGFDILYSKSGNPELNTVNADLMSIARSRSKTGWNEGRCLYGYGDKDGPALCSLLPTYTAREDD